ncbi:hypothetical protein [Peterkaempfera griseoplana]|uniref:hypothetical protein n=1 Tax=Peterkaempfera griseoplana TaxID=66896 RepID=UPI0006E1D09C|nr:hypothetical protein [Peterkaempfera griseoplana]
MWGNPDFELYDNVGRATAQIRSHNTGTPTDDDLVRWGLVRVRDRTARRALPADSGAATLPWTDLLVHCQDAAELAAVLERVSYDDGALPRLHQFLEQAAECARQIPGGQRIAEQLDAHAQALDDLAGQLQDSVQTLIDQARAGDLARARAEAAQAASPAAGPTAESTTNSTAALGQRTFPRKGHARP